MSKVSKGLPKLGPIFANLLVAMASKAESGSGTGTELEGKTPSSSVPTLINIVARR
jgi:hypothetical protein